MLSRAPEPTMHTGGDRMKARVIRVLLLAAGLASFLFAAGAKWKVG
jgi:hypothetical protein